MAKIENHIKTIGIGSAVIAFGVVVMACRIGDETGTLTDAFKDNPFTAAVGVMTSLFIVAVLLERSLAVIINIFIPEKENSLRGAVVATLEEDLAAARAKGKPLGPLMRNVRAAEVDLQNFREKKKWLRLCVGFLIATLVSASGFHTISQIIETANLDPKQQVLLLAIDVLLTAGLLAGGSQGIAEIIDIFKSNSDANKSAERAKNRVVIPADPSTPVDSENSGQTGTMVAMFTTPDRVAKAAAQPPVNQKPVPPFDWLNGQSIYSEYKQTVPAPPNPQENIQTVAGNHLKEPDDSMAFLETEVSMHGPASGLQSFGASGNPTQPRVAKALTHMRQQINAAYPNRRTASDGTIGDTNHCPGTSHHCPDDNGVIRAFDCTHDPVNGCDMNEVTGAIKKSQDPRIRYVIYNHQIFSSYDHKGIPAWTWRPYNGANPHTKHAHFSVESAPALYDDESDWKIEYS